MKTNPYCQRQKDSPGSVSISDMQIVNKFGGRVSLTYIDSRPRHVSTSNNLKSRKYYKIALYLQSQNWLIGSHVWFIDGVAFNDLESANRFQEHAIIRRWMFQKHSLSQRLYKAQSEGSFLVLAIAKIIFLFHDSVTTSLFWCQINSLGSWSQCRWAQTH